MTITLATLLLLSGLARADGFGDAGGIVGDAKALGAQRARRAAAPVPVDCGKNEGPGGSARKRECVCGGKRFLKTVFYKQNDLPILPGDGLSDFQIRRFVADAETALNYHGLTLGYSNMPQGADRVRSFGPAAFVTLRNYSEILRGQPHDPKAEPEALGAIDELCKVVADGFKQKPPGDDRLAVFFLNYSENLKKMTRGDGTEAVGHTFTAASFREMCAQLGEDATGLPKAFAVVQANPDSGVRQVLIHEMGHAIGKFATGVSPALFDDVYPKPGGPPVRNIMASRQDLAVGDMTMTNLQVSVLCASSFVSASEN